MLYCIVFISFKCWSPVTWFIFMKLCCVRSCFTILHCMFILPTHRWGVVLILSVSFYVRTWGASHLSYHSRRCCYLLHSRRGFLPPVFDAFIMCIMIAGRIHFSVEPIFGRFCVPNCTGYCPCFLSCLIRNLALTFFRLFTLRFGVLAICHVIIVF